MPELPEVEAARRKLERDALNRVVEEMSVRPDGMTMKVSEKTLRGAFRGHRLTAARRHGKHLFVRSGEDRRRWLRLHFGMTGELLVLESGEGDEVAEQADDEGSGRPDTGRRDSEHDRLRLDLAGGRSVVFRCPRKLGEIGLVESPPSFVEEKGLGPDVHSVDFDLKGFRRVLDGRRGTIKSALMNQQIVAGVGNEYSDEALYQADIHPGAKVSSLSDDDVKELRRVLGRVLAKAVEVRSGGGSLPSAWLMAHREEGETCPRCGGRIRNERIAGRSSYFCPDHQETG